MASAMSESVKEKRHRVLLGPLPEDFLQINPLRHEQQEAADRETALALQQLYTEGPVSYVINPAGRLSITVAQAKLAKNYGMTRMDPYCRIRVGHSIYETPTDPNGSKNPRWNKVVYCYLPNGINTITVEIFDERSFTMDELIAWAQITIPPQVLAGETHEDWYPLSGKQGEGVEGMINLVLTYTTAPPNWYAPSQPVMVVPRTDGTIKPVAVYPVPAPETNVAPPAPVLSESELKQIKEMFPNIENEVIKTVFEANRGDKESTINSLLQMAD
ncbi:toll-interacting protein-like [Diorhabda carinulata]|uniref:toll-interacting protein-like n=1 Tax=Diorhabda sublineata TaxID=1163346 RepID=UPI0024E164F2|nr:toll-interacting protein-like [Diorhabda sublineata]XP_057657924.1 toll-interacting protein-like [Diorhabda carinulata]